MGITKSDKFTNQQNDLANLFKALGHPARIAIIQTLLKRQACVCGDIVEDLPLSQSTISQHLAELKKVGLIKGTITGPSVCYCINASAWAKAKTEMDKIMSVLIKTPSVC
ncbi:MAG: metalloregulator ArsR/SmtB family transcription factor [Cyclobacteriaceae bacterium]|nr:metalloregulator ArsR/SmtB family transcription factor [Cyclobacteriaceae bacterium]